MHSEALTLLADKLQRQGVTADRLRMALQQAPHDKKTELVALVAELERRKKQRKFFTMYPDAGSFRRELYPKHMEFVEATSEYAETCLCAANRVGKTVCGAYMTTAHLTGLYPHWWHGKRFNSPTSFWAAGDTAKTVRDIIQVELLGAHDDRGTGMIPGDLIVRMPPKAGVADAIDTVYVKHHNQRGECDGISQLVLKSYDQGRQTFQGTSQHGIWLDEECPLPIYMECLMRTMTTGGIVYLTFTPLLGLTDVVMLYMETQPTAS